LIYEPEFFVFDLKYTTIKMKNTIIPKEFQERLENTLKAFAHANLLEVSEKGCNLRFETFTSYDVSGRSHQVKMCFWQCGTKLYQLPETTKKEIEQILVDFRTKIGAEQSDGDCIIECWTIVVCDSVNGCREEQFCRIICPVENNSAIPRNDEKGYIGRPFQIPGAPIASEGLPAKFVFPMGNKIIVINSKGEAWAHEVVI
jgi:hypothetical protein